MTSGYPRFGRVVIAILGLLAWMAVLLVPGAPAWADDPRQDKDPCGRECVCEGYTPEQLVEEYANAEWDWSGEPVGMQPCVYWFWQWGKGLGISAEELAPQFLRDRDQSCQSCRLPDTPTPEREPTGVPAATYPAVASTATSHPTSTPLPTPMPVDLSVEGVMVLQAVHSGGPVALVAYRNTAVRVFLGLPDAYVARYGAAPLAVDVALYLDERQIETRAATIVHPSFYTDQIKSEARNSVNFFLTDPQLLESGVHTFHVVASLANPTLVDPDPNNNVWAQQEAFLLTQEVNLLVYYAFPPGTQAREAKDAYLRGDLRRYLSQAHRLFYNLYPVERGTWGVRLYSADQPPYLAIRYVRGIEKRRLLENAQGGRYYAYAVGLYPQGMYGSGAYGISYWWNRRSVLASLDSPASVSHEVGHHRLGGTEEYELDPDGLGLSLPYGTTIYKGRENQLEVVTGDVGSGASVRYINIMGSAGTAPTWVNAETWNRLAQAYMVYDPLAVQLQAGGARTARPWTPEPEWSGSFVVSGEIGGDGTVIVDVPLYLDRVEREPTQVGADGGANNYELVLQNGSGSTLARVPIPLDLGTADPFPFLVTLPADLETAARLVVRHGEDELWASVPSLNPPQLAVTGPPVSSVGANSIELRWQGIDPDGDRLAYALLYSHDDGGTWTALAEGLAEPAYRLSADGLPGGDRCRLRVIASDGWHTGSATSEPFVMPNHTPTIRIDLPEDGASVSAGEAVTLLAMAYDPEEGVLDEERITWSSSRDGVLGHGSQVVVRELSPGRHTLTVTGRDAMGAEAQASITLAVAGGWQVGGIQLSLLLRGLGACATGTLALLILVVAFFLRPGRRRMRAIPGGSGVPIYPPSGSLSEKVVGHTRPGPPAQASQRTRPGPPREREGSWRPPPRPG